MLGDITVTGPEERPRPAPGAEEADWPELGNLCDRNLTRRL